MKLYKIDLAHHREKHVDTSMSFNHTIFPVKDFLAVVYRVL